MGFKTTSYRRQRSRRTRQEVGVEAPQAWFIRLQRARLRAQIAKFRDSSHSIARRCSSWVSSKSTLTLDQWSTNRHLANRKWRHPKLSKALIRSRWKSLALRLVRNRQDQGILRLVNRRSKMFTLVQSGSMKSSTPSPWRRSLLVNSQSPSQLIMLELLNLPNAQPATPSASNNSSTIEMILKSVRISTLRI